MSQWESTTILGLEPTTDSETSLLLEIQGVPWDLVPNAPRRGGRKKHQTPAPALPPVHEYHTDDKSSSSRDSSSSLSSAPAPSGLPQHVSDQADSRSQPQTAMDAHVPVVPTSTALPTSTPEALIGSSAPTKRAAEPTTLDVPPQAKHP